MNAPRPPARRRDPERLRRRGVARAGIAAAAVSLLAVGALDAAPPAAAAGSTLVVDAGVALRPVTHVGSGGLYALADPSNPNPALLPPLRLNQLTQPPPDVQQLGNGATTPTGDALKVAPNVINAGAQQTIRMPDIYPDFPYRWVSWADYEQKIDTMVRKRLAATNTTNINGWELWNEPDGTWDTAKAGPYQDGWNRIYRKVRSLDPLTPIVGPSYSSYNYDEMKAFLSAAKAAGTLPDVVCWHELRGYGLVTGDVQSYRGLERELGISPRPISIDEYATPDEVDVPSAALHYVSQFERTGVRDAERAYWFESGTIGGLVWNNQPTSTYWMYKWLGDQAGNIVSVTPPNNYLDGTASYDQSRKLVNVVFGGETGSNTVVVKGLSSFGSSVRVQLRQTVSSGRMTTVPTEPTPFSTATYPVSNGQISIPVANMDARYAYQAVVTPVGGPTTSYQQVYEAENATVVNATRYTSAGASNGGYVGGIDGGSNDVRTASFVDFLTTVPAAGNYRMTIRYANGTGATSTQGLAYNGSAWTTVSYPPTAGWGQFSTVTTTIPLRAGSNVIRLAKGSPFLTTATGFAELDSITLQQA